MGATQPGAAGSPDRRPLVGVLALQGDFARHRAAWERVGARTREVRTAADLEGLDALSLPGGESTTMLRLLRVLGLRAAFRAAVERLPVFATCAGAILLGKGATRLPDDPLEAMDVDVLRNAYGRQIDSFEAPVAAPAFGGGDAPLTGVFIRAPRFTRVGPGVEVVARLEGEPVGVRQGRHVALAFHPELTDDARPFAWFLAQVVGAPAAPSAAADGTAAAPGLPRRDARRKEGR